MEVDAKSVTCHFRCPKSQKVLVVSVDFGPFEIAEISVKDWILSPITSYKKRYATPITLYAQECQQSLLFKAFKKVAFEFKWSDEYNSYILKE
jgi:hypothetical protein